MANYGVQVEGVKALDTVRVYYTAAVESAAVEATWRRGGIVVKDATEPAGKEGVCVRLPAATTSQLVAGFVVGWTDDSTSVAQWIDIAPIGQQTMAVYEGVAKEAIPVATAVKIDLADSYKIDDSGAGQTVGTSVTASAADGDKILFWAADQ